MSNEIGETYTYNGCVQCIKRQNSIRLNHFSDFKTVQKKSQTILDKAHASNRNLEKRLEKEIENLTKFHENDEIMHKKRKEELLRGLKNFEIIKGTIRK